MEETFYVSISLDNVTEEEANQIIEEIVRLRGTRSGMSVSYADPIV